MFAETQNRTAGKVLQPLLSHYGNHRKGFSKVDNECFEYFKSIYLREGAPSVETAWSINVCHWLIKICQNSRQISEKSTPGSLREFSNFLCFEGRISKLSDTNSKTHW